MDARVLVALAGVQMALLYGLAVAEPPHIELADAPKHEGQGDVVVAGILTAQRPWGEATRLTLTSGDHRIDAMVRDALHLSEGSWVEAEGRIGRSGGTLTLFAIRVEASQPPDPARPSWPDLAASPQSWEGRWLVLQGKVAQGRLGDGEGHHVSLGQGTWPKGGAVEAEGHVAYDAKCLCHRFHAAAVRAWT
jgi:hypothetical protein